MQATPFIEVRQGREPFHRGRGSALIIDIHPFKFGQQRLNPRSGIRCVFLQTNRAHRIARLFDGVKILKRNQRVGLDHRRLRKFETTKRVKCIERVVAFRATLGVKRLGENLKPGITRNFSLPCTRRRFGISRGETIFIGRFLHLLQPRQRVTLDAGHQCRRFQIAQLSSDVRRSLRVSRRAHQRKPQRIGLGLARSNFFQLLIQQTLTAQKIRMPQKTGFVDGTQFKILPRRFGITRNNRLTCRCQRHIIHRRLELRPHIGR